MPADDYARLSAYLKPVEVVRGHVLHGPGTDVGEVYFPVSGVCGVMAITEGGHGVEVSSIGCEGMTGVYGLGEPQAPVHVVVQVAPAVIQRLHVDVFRREMDLRGALHNLVSDYYRAFFSEVVQSVACNRLHSTNQRYCRRLLSIADRGGSDVFTLTHDMMSAMLGIQRPAVSVIASSLKQAGLIDYTRAEVVITNRRGLEAAACACYALSRQRIAHLLPPRN